MNRGWCDRGCCGGLFTADDTVESEWIVRGPHSCQNLPPAVEEVGRILREHLRMVVLTNAVELPL